MIYLVYREKDVGCSIYLDQHRLQTVFAVVVDHVLDGGVGVAVDEGGDRVVVGVELVDERSEPLVEEPHHLIHLLHALTLWAHPSRGPQARGAAQRAHTGQ